MNNLYALVLFLVFIMSTSSSFCDDGDKDIIMVVEDENTMHDINEAGTWMSKANQVQSGTFLLEDGTVLQLSRKSSPGRNYCVGLGQPCGANDPCCDPYYCNGYAFGTCQTEYCGRTLIPCLHDSECCDGSCTLFLC